jgi:hypothetical protein
MRRRLGTIAAVLLAATIGEAGVASLGVIDLPYTRVWEAGLRAVEGYPVERAGQGRIETGWVEAAPARGEAGFTRVTERVTLRIEAVGDQVTRVTAVVEARGWRGGEWVLLADTDARAEAFLDRLVRRL